MTKFTFSKLFIPLPVQTSVHFMSIMHFNYQNTTNSLLSKHQPPLLIHWFIFSNHFTLVRVMVALESMLGHWAWSENVHSESVITKHHAHTLEQFRVAKPPTAFILDETGTPRENPHRHWENVKLHKYSNPNSGSNMGLWSCEVAMPCFVPPCCATLLCV